MKKRWTKAIQKQFDEIVDRALSRNLEYYDHRYTVHRDEVKQLRESVNRFNENLIGTCRYLVSEELARVMFSGELTNMAKNRMAICARCGEKFKCSRVKQIYCSRRCGDAARQARKRAKQ